MLTGGVIMRQGHIARLYLKSQHAKATAMDQAEYFVKVGLRNRGLL